jgi:pantoate--beta-alanine ligase
MITTVETLPELRSARAELAEPVGLVPTMGYLHDGHLSLFRSAKRECQSLVATIFVNPTQFGPNEDLESYPRDIPRDLDLLASTGCDLVWIPPKEALYPKGYQTWVMVDQVTRLLEGEYRPSHFKGVTTIVAKLFNAVMPQKAYFGQKDAQQAVVIQRMALDLNFPIEIKICPIIREADGLAMSSRNAYLDVSQRGAAGVLYQALCAVKDAIERGERDSAGLKRMVMEIITSEPQARLEYVAISDPQTLSDLKTVEQDALISMAVYIGDIRLIDNFLLQDGRWQTGILYRG